MRIRKIQADVENAKLARLESERAGCRWELNLLPINLRNAADGRETNARTPISAPDSTLPYENSAIGGAP